MFMVREIETYVRENAGDVVQEGRWRTTMMKEMSRLHFHTMTALDGTHRLVERLDRSTSREQDAGGRAGARPSMRRQRNANTALPTPAPMPPPAGPVLTEEVGALRRDVGRLSAMADKMMSGLDELRAEMRARRASASDDVAPAWAASSTSAVSAEPLAAPAPSARRVKRSASPTPTAVRL